MLQDPLHCRVFYIEVVYGDRELGGRQRRGGNNLGDLAAAVMEMIWIRRLAGTVRIQAEAMLWLTLVEASVRQVVTAGLHQLLLIGEERLTVRG